MDDLPERLDQLYPVLVVGGSPIYLSVLFDDPHAGVGEDLEDGAGLLSGQDVRRRFAQRLLVEKEISPRVVRQVGGWDPFQAIELYLNATMPDVVNDAF